jgi:lantibiotic transport system ATP-binding protein
MPAIETQGLTRVFPSGHGVHALDLYVPERSIYGFLGPNGSGKTTTIRMLLDLLRPQAGTVRLFGQPLDRGHRGALAQVGALVESPSLYAHLSGEDNLEITRRLLDAPKARIGEALARVGLSADAHRCVREYSLGMRQRLAIALALLGRPKLLILDEPSNGLDPAGIAEMRALLRRLVADDGLTVFLSSHLLHEIDLLASHVGLLQDGRLRFEGTLRDLRMLAPAHLMVATDANDAALDVLLGAGAHARREDAERIRIELGEHNASALNRLLVSHGIGVSHLAQEAVSLESIFFRLTSQPHAEAAA